MNVYIIIINFNGCQETLECIKSLRNQTFQNFKTIIVDNASANEDVIRLRKECPECQIIVSDKNLGFSGGNNLGIKYAIKHNASAIVFLNNDTVLKENCLEILLDNLQDNECICPQMRYFSDKSIINFAGGYFNYKTGAGCISDRGAYYDDKDTRRREIRLANGCCMVMTVNTIEKLGPWKEEFFLYREDDEYTLRMFSKGIKIFYEPRAILWHKESMSTGGNKGAAYRHYYLLRNRLYNIRDYKLGKFVLIKTILASFVRYIQFLFEKKEQYRYSITAVADFFMGKTGEKTFIK